MRTFKSKNFAQTPAINVPRAAFDRSSDLKTTFDADYLVPVFLDEVLPGDTMEMNASFFARFNSPLVRPLMDNVYLKIYWFYCADRILWDNAKKFYGEQVDPADSTDYTRPKMDNAAAPISTTGYTVGSLGDYLGLPTEVTSIEVSAFPFEMYNRIWNTFFRDQNLDDSVEVSTADADRDPANYVLLKKRKAHDYFTSALPWAQKNNSGTEVTLPLGTEAPIFGDNMDFDATDDTDNHFNVRDAAGASANLRAFNYNGLLGGAGHVYGDNAASGTGELKVDLSAATAASVNDLRLAIATQQYYEILAQGSRYHEALKYEFNVQVPFETFEPQYLGGTTIPINIHSVPNTTGVDSTQSITGNDEYQGELTAFASAAGGSGFFQSFTEPGWVMGVCCAIADVTYQEGIERMWTRETILDMYHPVFQGIGEQAIRKDEIYAQGTSADSDAWAYQERYAEYKYKPSKITGALRSSYANSLDVYHLAEELGGMPTFNASFMTSNTPMDRVIAVPGEHHFIMDCNFNYKCIRNMFTYARPGLTRI